MAVSEPLTDGHASHDDCKHKRLRSTRGDTWLISRGGKRKGRERNGTERKDGEKEVEWEGRRKRDGRRDGRSQRRRERRENE